MGIRPSVSLWAALRRVGGALLGPLRARRARTPPTTVDAPNAAKGSGLPISALCLAALGRGQCPHRPGTRYPVDWVFKRKAMPVEIVAEYENWRKIRDWQGASGWVHQSLLTGKRSFIIAAKAASLHKTPADRPPRWWPSWSPR